MRKQYTLVGFSRLQFHQNKFCTKISQVPGNGIGQGYVIRGPFPKKHGFSRWNAKCSLLALYNLCYTNLQDESWQMHYCWRKATRPWAGHFISLGPCFLHCGLLGPLVQGAPSSTNIPRLLVQTLLSSSCCGCTFRSLSPAFKYRVTLTFYAYGWKQLLSRSRQLISQVHCSAKCPTLIFMNAPYTPF